MNPTLVIAGLTVREAVRRRLVLALVAITLALVSLSAWGFYRLSHNHSLTSGEVQASLPQSLTLFMFMFSFVVALSASAMASPAVSAELESGVLQSVLTRPIRRSHVLLGKWLGLTAVLGAYTATVCGLEIAVVDLVSGFAPPAPVAVAVYLFAEGVSLLSLVLLLSTRLSAIAAGVVGVALFGGAWLAGVVGSLGATFNIAALRTVGAVGRYVLPTDGLWHGAVFHLEPASFLAERLARSAGPRNDPFFAKAPPSAGYLAWVGVWFVLVLAAGLVSFERREV